MFMFDSNDELSSLESWVGRLFVRCCGEECVMQSFIEMMLLLSSCNDLVDSRSNPGEKFSEEACVGKGSIYNY